MTLAPKHLQTVSRIRQAFGEPFSELVKIADLDKKTDFVNGNLRGVDFGASDLAGFSFAGADLTNADMTNATGKDRLVLTGALLDGARGLPERSDETSDDPTLPALVRIPAGEFLMGTPDTENKREKVPSPFDEWTAPQRSIVIPLPFWIGKYPVTRGQFRVFVEAKRHSMTGGAGVYESGNTREWQYRHDDNRDWQSTGFDQTDDHPVVCVSHADAMAYVAWLREVTGKDYRLPSEAEWEYAARAGTTTARYWGNGRDQATRFAQVAGRSLRERMKLDFDPDRFFPGDTSYPFTAPVGSILPNPFGLYDMLGNVWDWCADVWTKAPTSIPSDGTPNTIGDSGRRVVRGGSWFNFPRDVRAGYRSSVETGTRVSDIGFRVARMLSGPES